MRFLLFIFVGLGLLCSRGLAATQSMVVSGNLTVAGTVKNAAGISYVLDAPNDGQPYARRTNGWVVVSAGGLSDAPNDGHVYGRLGGAWADLDLYYALDDHTHPASDIVSGILGTAQLGHGTANSSVFLRGDSAWAAVGWADVTGKPTTFAPTSHTHDWADVTGEPTFALESHTHAAADIVSGLIDSARLGEGTANSSVYLRGDGTWATPPSGSGAGITDAPNDGHAYWRDSEAWIQASASDLEIGTLPSGRLSGAYTGVTGLGTLTALTVTGNSSLKAVQAGSSAGYIAGWTSDPTTSGNNLIWRSPSQILSDIGAAASADVPPNSRSISTTHSLTGGGNLSADRTLSLVGDTSSPGNTKYYGTDGSGSRGWHALVAGSPPAFVGFAGSADTNEDTTYRSVLGSAKSGYSTTFGANTLTTDTVLKFELCGSFTADDGHNLDVELKLGSSWKLHFDVTEPGSEGPLSGTPWNITAFITISTAGSSATVKATAWMDYHHGDGHFGSYGPSSMVRSRGEMSGTLDTTAANVFDLVYRGNDTTATSFELTHAITTKF